jgi:PH/SEC7 domain-containing protein
MSRNQFIRNTMSAINSQFQPSSPARVSSSDLTYDDCGSSVRAAGFRTRSTRSDSITSWSSVSREGLGSPSSTPVVQDSSLPSSQTPTAQDAKASPDFPHGREWEGDMETLLKVCLDLTSLELLDNFFFRRCIMRSRTNRSCSP